MRISLRSLAMMAGLMVSFAAFAQPIPHPNNGRVFEEAFVPRVYMTLPADTMAWILQNVTSDRE